MANYYTKITTDSGVSFEANKKGIAQIVDQTEQGTLTGYIAVYKKGKGHTKTPALHAKVHEDKVEIFYYS